MVKTFDEAILLNTSKYSETSVIATLFSLQHGVIKGLIKGALSPKNKYIYMQGNILNFQKNARIEEQLGNITANLLHSNLANIFNNPTKLLMLNSVCLMLNNLLPVDEKNTNLYNTAKSFILNAINSTNYIQNYLWMELEILKAIGYGLNLTKCIVSGDTQNLYYVSPKTGNAVSYIVGEPYKDKLFVLPYVLLDTIVEDPNKENIINAFKIITYFFNSFAKEYNKTIPNIREELVLKMVNTAKI
jgi:DNA repair protein RecO (recombination protein O)